MQTSARARGRVPGGKYLQRRMCLTFHLSRLTRPPAVRMPCYASAARHVRTPTEEAKKTTGSRRDTEGVPFRVAGADEFELQIRTEARGNTRHCTSNCASHHSCATAWQGKTDRQAGSQRTPHTAQRTTHTHVCLSEFQHSVSCISFDLTSFSIVHFTSLVPNFAARRTTNSY